MTQPTETELKLRREITTLEQQVLEKHADNIKLRKQIEFLTLTTNEAGAKISKLTKEVKDAKKTNQELTNEMILVKGITVNNSPEILTLQYKIIELETRVEGVIDPVQKARESGL